MAGIGKSAVDVSRHCCFIKLYDDRCTFSNCQHIHEPGCCVREDFDRHPIYIELYHEVRQNEDLERHRSMSKKVNALTYKYNSNNNNANNQLHDMLHIILSQNFFVLSSSR